MKRIFPVFCLITIALAACGAESVKQDHAQPPAMESNQSCSFPQWVSKPVDRAAIEKLGRPHRVIAEGSAVTMDYSPNRLNVEHKNNIVTRVWCG